MRNRPTQLIFLIQSIDFTIELENNMTHLVLRICLFVVRLGAAQKVISRLGY